jgi:hydroxymethylpyrimidine pyrophosphatase-like HAD family hydrolase
VEEAKQAAHFVTKSVLEDGIDYALRHYGLL